ncbi:MAG: hypothetical protein GY857_15600 [Desulfobacula sp.]|nr:hypothetical protein [Desulfobacula sp.]
MDKTKKIEGRIIRIKLTDGTQINGQANIGKNTGYDRLSDLIDSSQEQFLTIINATVHEVSLDKPVRYKTIFINKKHMLWATPEDGQK